MLIPLVAGALMCVTPKVKDTTGLPWTQTDQQSLLYAQKVGCRKNSPDQPCLVIFSKVEENTYAVICGPEVLRKEDEQKSR